MLFRSLYRAARYQEAESVWAAAAAKLPDNEALHRNLGAVHHMLGRHDQAAAEFQKALELNPLPATYSNLGTIRFFQGKYDAAVPAFEKAVDGRPGSYLYWGNLGDAYRWATGTRPKALAAYTRAVQLARAEGKSKPNDLDLRSRLVLYLVKLGDTDAARVELASIPPAARPAAVWFRLTVAWELLKDREAALNSLDQALRAGYLRTEIEGEPELATLRADRRYHVRMARVDPVAPPK